MESKNGKRHVKIYLPEDEGERFIVEAVVGRLAMSGAAVTAVSDEAVEIAVNSPCGAIVDEIQEYMDELKELIRIYDYDRIRKPSIKALKIECLNHR